MRNSKLIESIQSDNNNHSGSNRLAKRLQLILNSKIDGLFASKNFLPCYRDQYYMAKLKI